MTRKIFFLGWFLLFTWTGISLAAAEEAREKKGPPTEPTGQITPNETDTPFLYRWGVGLRSSYFQTTDTQNFRSINRMEEEQDYTPSRVFLSYQLYKHLYLEGEAFLKALVSRPRNVNTSAYDGDLQWTPYFLTLQARIPSQCRFQPYLSLGVAYIRTEFNPQPYYRNGYDNPEEYAQYFPTRGVVKTREFSPEENVWGAQFGIGADYYVTKHFSLNLDIRYLIAQVNFKYRVTAGNVTQIDEQGSFNLDSWLLGFGLRYSF
jgi:hypothetical protein